MEAAAGTLRTVAATAALVTLMAVLYLPTGGHSSPLPPVCSDGRTDVARPTNCLYGWTVDKCGKRVCLKGPGEMCGGKYGRYGICSDGLMCSNCNRCQGCSFQTFMCWDDRNCIW